jgi:hypothetical protein
MRALFLTVIFSLFAVAAHAEPVDEHTYNNALSDETAIIVAQNAKGEMRAEEPRRLPKAGQRYDYNGRTHFAQQNFGVGICLFRPTGVTAKYYFDPWNAISAAAGFGISSRRDTLRLNIDYNWHPNTIAANQDLDLRWYFGGGLILAYVNQQRANKDNDKYLAAGFRLPIGIQAELNKLPLEIYTELAPAMLAPKIYFQLDFALGLRYYFR